MELTWSSGLVLVLLGAGHGLNPGMGWLFAVALGLQRQSPKAVWQALGPLAAGHALAIALALTIAILAGAVIPAGMLKWLIAALLLGFGLHRILIDRHPRFGSMRVGPRDLTLWSLLMASAHGAGLMVVPVLLPEGANASGGHAHHAPAALQQASLLSQPVWDGLLASGLHTAGYLLVTGIIAAVVYHKLGLRLLRKAWINLDLLWAGALILTAVVVVL